MDELNLDGILDEALRIDEKESTKETLQPRTELKDELEITRESEEHSLSGTLEEVLGFDSESGLTEQPFGTESPFAASSPAGGAALDNDAATVLDNHFEVTNPEPAEQAPITDPAKTRLADSLPSFAAPQKDPLESTSPNVQVPNLDVQVGAIGDTKEPKKMVVPIHISIDRDTDEIHLSLDIKIDRKE
jgi:hypothetical protein